MLTKNLILSLGLALSSASLLAAPFEGTARFKTLGSESKGAKEMDFSIKGEKFRLDIDQGGHKATVIMDSKAKQAVTIVSERKAYMVMSLDRKGAATEEAKPAGKLVKTGKTETIAGYKAEEWDFEGGEPKTSIWGTQELGGWSPVSDPRGRGPQLEIPAELKDGNFFPLRVVGEHGGMEAVKVTKKSLPASLFEVPEGYEAMELGAFGGLPPAGAKGSKDPSAEQQKLMMERMKRLSPEQRAMMEKMMKEQGGR